MGPRQRALARRCSCCGEKHWKAHRSSTESSSSSCTLKGWFSCGAICFDRGVPQHGLHFAETLPCRSVRLQQPLPRQDCLTVEAGHKISGRFSGVWASVGDIVLKLVKTP